MQSLRGGEDAMLRLDQLEALYYELQLQLYDIKAEVLRCEELLLTAQLQSLRRQMTGELRLFVAQCDGLKALNNTTTRGRRSVSSVPHGPREKCWRRSPGCYYKGAVTF